MKSTQNWNYHFSKSKEFFHQGDFKKTLMELKVCMGGIEKEFTDVDKLPPRKALEVTLKFSNVLYWRTLCFYSAGSSCCARKNVYFLYDSLRSLFLNSRYDGNFRNTLREELKRVTDLYQKFGETSGPDNLINDFKRIYYTKILINSSF